MTGEHDIAVFTLAVTLLGTVVVSTWRFSSLASTLLAAVKRLETKETQQDERIKLLDEIPAMRNELAHVTKNHSLIPGLLADVKVLQAGAKHSGEMRQVLLRQSRPDKDED